jgi:lysophosphatidate acyltransferase
VPVVVGPVAEVFDLGRRVARPGTVSVRILDPIPTAGLTESDVDDLIATTRRKMQDALDAMVAERSRGARLLTPP